MATRKKFPAKTLGPGQSIFHDYKWEPPKQSDGEGAKIARGRKPYEWTPERSRQLIKLIIHTDLPFDDVTKIMRDADGEGPSESTCRNHWHDIFGYRPDEARLKNPEGREVRRSKLLRAFHRDTGTASPDTNRTEPDLVRDGPIDADSSPAASSNSSAQYPNSMTEGDNNVAISQVEDDMNYSFLYNPALTLTPPEEQDFRNVQYGFPSTSHTRLPSVVEEGPAVAPDTKREQSSPANTSTPTPDSTVSQIEQKQDLPPGFINWFRRTSIGSSFFTEGRHQSVAGSLATSRRRSYQPNRSSIATISQPLSSNAILNILENSDSTTTIQAGHIEKLIDRGADINACNAKGETPLHLAMRLGNIVVFSALLARGANPNARTKTGESIWTYGRNASKQTLDPNKQYVDKDQQRLDTMICAHIEFLKATSQFNRDLITESKGKKGSKYSSSLSADQNKDSKRRRSSATSSNSSAPPVLPWSMTAYGTGSSKKQKKPRSVDSNATEQTQGRMSSLGESVTSNETDPRPSMHKSNSSPSPYTNMDTSQHLSSSAPSSDGKRLSWGMSWLSKKSQSGGNPYMSNISTQVPATQQDPYHLESASPRTTFVSNGFDAQQMPTSGPQFQDWHFPDPSALRPQTYYGETGDLVAFPNSLATGDPSNIPYDYSGEITPTQSFILDPTAQAETQAATMYGAPTSQPNVAFNEVAFNQLNYSQPMPASNLENCQPDATFTNNAFEQPGFSMDQALSWEARYRALEQQMEQQRQQNELLMKQLAHQSAWLDSTMYHWDAPAGPAT